MNSSPANVAVLVGSLRTGSFSRKLALALAARAPAGLVLDLVEIDQLPFYNQDLETDSPPPPWVVFRDRVRTADAVLFVTPEYNRSVPAVLKNAIDVGSRPRGSAVWTGKPGAVVSNSPGAIGGFGANHHLRQSLVFVDVLMMAQPEVYLSGVDKLFDPDGKIVNPSVGEFLDKFLAAFAKWIARNRS